MTQDTHDIARIDGPSAAHAQVGHDARLIMDTLPQRVWSAWPNGHHDYYDAC